MTNKLVPKLRFPEFSGEWDLSKVGDLCISIVPGRNKPTLFNGDIPWITIADIKTTKISTSINMLFVSEKEACEISSKILPVGTVIMSCVGQFGIVGISINRVIINQQLHSFICSELLNNYFLMYSLVTQVNFMDQVSTKTSVPYMNKENCNSIPIYYPQMEEQTKIADFLTSVDDKIQQLTKKKALLEQYKKGVMQQIFSQQLRFKDDSGKDYPAWQERTLGDIAIQLVNGVSLEQNDYSNGYKVTRIETISDTYININRVGFIDTSVNIEGYKLKIGDMLFSNINSVKHIGKIAYVDKDYNLYHGMNLLKIRINDKNNSKYMYYVLTSIKYKSHFEKICNQAVNQASINQSELKKTTMHLPYLEEQTKIADFLTSIDDKITQVTAMLKQIQQYKKSLLQQMFI